MQSHDRAGLLRLPLPLLLSFASLLLLAAFGFLRLPEIAPFLTAPLFEQGSDLPAPAAGETAWRSPLFPPGPAASLSRLAVSVSGHQRMQAWLEDASGRRSRPLEVQSGPGPVAWQGTLHPPSAAPQRLVLDWSSHPDGRPRFASLSVRPLDPRYYARRQAVFLCRALALGFALFAAGIALRKRLGPDRFATLAWRRLLPAALFALILWGCLLRYDGARGPRGHTYGFSGLIDMGAYAYDHTTERARQVDFKVNSFSGYDSAGYIQIALDPLLEENRDLAAALGGPTYRAKRILLPALAWIGGLGHPAAIVQAFALLNLPFWLLLLALLLRAFPKASVEQGAILVGVLLATGTLESVRRALVDLPTTVCLAAALLALRSPRPGWQAPLAWGAACLARETSSLGAGLLTVLWRGKTGEKGKTAPSFWIGLGLALAAIGGWYAYVHHRFPAPPGQVSTLGTGTEKTLGWPLAALLRQLLACFGGGGDGGLGNPDHLQALLAIASLLTQACFLLRHPRPDSAAWRMGLPFVVLLACFGDAVWDGRTPSALRVGLPLTLAFHWELASTDRRGAAFWKWWIPANLYLWQGLADFLVARAI